VANHPQAEKRARQRDKRQAHHRHFKSAVRTQIKRVKSAIEDKDLGRARRGAQGRRSPDRPMCQQGDPPARARLPHRVPAQPRHQRPLLVAGHSRSTSCSITTASLSRLDFSFPVGLEEGPMGAPQRGLVETFGLLHHLRHEVGVDPDPAGDRLPPLPRRQAAPRGPDLSEVAGQHRHDAQARLRSCSILRSTGQGLPTIAATHRPVSSKIERTRVCTNTSSTSCGRTGWPRPTYSDRRSTASASRCAMSRSHASGDPLGRPRP